MRRGAKNRVIRGHVSYLWALRFLPDRRLARLRHISGIVSRCLDSEGMTPTDRVRS